MNDFDQNPTGYTHLLSPARLGALDLPNRIVMAPLTRNRASMDGVPGELNALYYAQRAGAAFIISEAVAVSAQGVGYPAMPARIARQAPLAEPDPATFYGGDAHGYTDYPSLEAEVAS